MCLIYTTLIVSSSGSTSPSGMGHRKYASTAAMTSTAPPHTIFRFIFCPSSLFLPVYHGVRYTATAAYRSSFPPQRGHNKSPDCPRHPARKSPVKRRAGLRLAICAPPWYDRQRMYRKGVSVKVSTGSAQIKGRTEPALPTSKFSGQSGRMAKTVRRNQGRLGLAF